MGVGTYLYIYWRVSVALLIGETSDSKSQLNVKFLAYLCSLIHVPFAPNYMYMCLQSMVMCLEWREQVEVFGRVGKFSSAST